MTIVFGDLGAMEGRDQGCAGRKPAFDKYATVKSGGNMMLSGGILADNLTEIIDLYKATAESEPYRELLLVLLYLCLILNIVCIVLSLVLGSLTYPGSAGSAAYNMNVIVPTNMPITAQSAENMGQPRNKVNLQSTASQTMPAHRTPGYLRVMNNLMTVFTGTVFILVAAKNSIRSGRYAHCPCINSTFTKQ